MQEEILNISVNNLVDLYKASFQSRDFDFITIREGDNGDLKNKKQEEALNYLTDDETVEFLFGGAAGPGKSWIGCAWLVFMSLCYPGTRWFIGREELKRLRGSTLKTFFKVTKAYGLLRGIDYKYNGQDHYIEFSNGSWIDLLDLKFIPSDDMYERYGSSEYTGGWIEEGGECHMGAYDTLKTRIGRHMNDEYGLMRKLLITANPKKNWMYSEFYKPWKDGTLKPYQKYLPALVQDNPHIDKQYIHALESTKDKARKERLLYGNWDYDDDPAIMMEMDAIVDLFTNHHVLPGDSYITADIARLGKDSTIIGIWSGLQLNQIIKMSHKRTTEVAAVIKNYAKRGKIPMSRVIVDEDGVGGGVMDTLNCKGFVNGSSSVAEKGNETNYKNLRSQCYFKLAEKVNEHEIFINETGETAEYIKEELSIIKALDIDSDVKPKAVITREEIITLLGRSPDYASMIMMRMWFLLKSERWGGSV